MVSKILCFNCVVLELFSFKKDEHADQPKYLSEAQHLSKPERSTLTVSFADIQDYNQSLATVITEEYFR